jgi:hypothetical protein
LTTRIGQHESESYQRTHVLYQKTNQETNQNKPYPDPEPCDQFIFSVVVLMYLLYPTLCKQVFRLFACVEIGPKKWYFSVDLQVECYIGYHLTMVLLVGVPKVLLYIFGLPILGLYIMYQNHEKRSEAKIKYRYGLLYSGYRPGMLYWEVVTAFRKVFVAGLAVLASDIGVSMQIHVGMFVLMVFLCSHLTLKPYVERWSLLDKFETASLVICWFSLWSGIVYINNASYNSNTSGNHIWRDLITGFIILVNVAFMIFGFLVAFKQKLHDSPKCCSERWRKNAIHLLQKVPLVEHNRQAEN